MTVEIVPNREFALASIIILTQKLIKEKALLVWLFVVPV